jgi:poly(3-hydroxybutyrate) depolymerase
VRSGGVVAASLLLVAISVAPSPSIRSQSPARDGSFRFADGAVLVHIPRNAGTVGVVVLHSLGNSAEEPVAQGWSAAADRHGFVAIFPDRGTSWNAGICCGTASETSRDDVSWLTQVIALGRARYHLTSILLAGFSNGGMMIERLITEVPSVSSHFAVWGSAPEMPKPGHWPGQGAIFEGNDDVVVPPDGGTVTFDGATDVIRPASSTSDWILGAQLHLHVIPGFGHAPPPNWPEMAWDALVQDGPPR